MPKAKLTPGEYADKRGITLQAVTAAIRRKASAKKVDPLASVTKIEKFGRFYLLTVNLNEKGELA